MQSPVSEALIGLLFRAAPATQIRYDGDNRESVPGFGVRVYPSGRKAFVVWDHTPRARKRMHTMGRYGTLAVQQGRNLARQA